MEQIGKIVSISQNIAQIEIKRKSSCSSDCSKCGGCAHPDQIMLVEAKNTCDAKIGENVILHAQTGGILSIAALVYVMPIILLFVGYFIMPGGEGAKILGSLIGLLIGIAFCMAYSSYVKRKKKKFFTIELTNLQNS